MKPATVILLAALGLPACATSRAPDAVLVVRTPVAAQLYIDDQFVGGAGRALGLRAGHHRVEVRAEGRLASYRDVDLRRGDRVTLNVPLRPDLDSDDVEEPAPAKPAAPPVKAGGP